MINAFMARRTRHGDGLGIRSVVRLFRVFYRTDSQGGLK